MTTQDVILGLDASCPACPFIFTERASSRGVQGRRISRFDQPARLAMVEIPRFARNDNCRVDYLTSIATL